MRAVLVCPGRGSYTKAELGSIAARAAAGGPAAERLLLLADGLRAAAGRPGVRALDSEPSFRAAHLEGENASALIFAATALDAATLDPELVPVAVLGNSMGWYTALYVAGALDFEAGFRLAGTMGSYQARGIVGGQVIYPLVDEEWRRDPAREVALRSAIAAASEAGAVVEPSIRLGGFIVLGADDAGLAVLKRELPPVRRGEREYPFQLFGHSAFHTRLMERTRAAALAELADLPTREPKIPLIDGKGRQHRPQSADPERLLAITLDEQVVETFDFTVALRVALREYAPDRIVLLEPGASLGGAIGQVVVAEGWRGIRSRTDFVRVQESDRPLLIARGRRPVPGSAS
jgi:[acyl-carrier-protein] S-malonyltransferase